MTGGVSVRRARVISVGNYSGGCYMGATISRGFLWPTLTISSAGLVRTVDWKLKMFKGNGPESPLTGWGCWGGGALLG